MEEPNYVGTLILKTKEVRLLKPIYSFQMNPDTKIMVGRLDPFEFLPDQEDITLEDIAHQVRIQKRICLPDPDVILAELKKREERDDALLTISKQELLGKIMQTEYRKISKSHFYISMQDGSYFLTDQKSHNGTRVNKQKISDASIELRNGDTIYIIKNVGFLVEIESQEIPKDDTRAIHRST